ncbi:xylulokinase [Paracoccus sp. S-4012]|uniref:xylulokinase n=1 Tax=Paracoccus sp. S-4012 TaxID=2665648 RepID=UPI0012AEEF3D|nr:xylulokinase [Paracoccus sp. S-4012]MRX52071.1 xylulokinase [Paracoccus sp. S-4012]
MYLGLDLGTSGVKALLMEGDAVVATATAPLSVSRPRPGWSEQAPEDWRAAAVAAVAGLGRDLSGVRGIGLSGQMHGAVCLDAGQRVLRPAILWDDGRAEAEARALDADPRFRAITGNIVFTGFTAPKLVWMARYEPELRARVARVLLPKDWLRLWLIGEAVSEPSDAAGTAWLDLATRDWSDELLATTGLDRATMPRLVEGTEVSGTLRAQAAVELGLPPSIPVAGGAGDNAATAVGVGLTQPGRSLLSLGTSGVIFSVTSMPMPAPETAVHSFAHAIPDRWHHMGVTLAAGASLAWLADLTGAPPEALLAELGEGTEPGEVAFYPYLSGERTPWNAPALRGRLDRLSAAHSRADLSRAVLEGVGFSLADAVAAMERAGSRVEAPLALGGGAKSDVWLGILANILGRPVERPREAAHAAASGAARLGRLAAERGDPASLPQPEVERRFEPDPAKAEAWRTARARWRSSSPAYAPQDEAGAR